MIEVKTKNNSYLFYSAIEAVRKFYALNKLGIPAEINEKVICI